MSFYIRIILLIINVEVFAMIFTLHSNNLFDNKCRGVCYDIHENENFPIMLAFLAFIL